MTFVNQISEIVHGVVNEFHGAANKNNGYLFLLIWRTSGLESAMVARMADMSMVAFAKILGAIHRSPILAAYRSHPGLQQRLGSDCRVGLSCGLHAGWAIEGAVGSEYKIDASYLSPNVSIAASVEAATTVYGVPILVSQAVHDICTHEIAVECRLIDRVSIRGSKQPIALYCLDLDYTCLPVDEDSCHRRPIWNSRTRFRARQFLEIEKMRKLEPDVHIADVFHESPEIVAMRKAYDTKFLKRFNMGYQNYAEGEWDVAKRFLEETKNPARGGHRPKAEDGPSVALLQFMANADFKAPAGWQGVRELSVS